MIFINDFSKPMIHSNNFLYADDTAIMVQGKTIDHIERRLNTQLNLAHSWLGGNKLMLNDKKPVCMVLGTKQKIRRSEGMNVSLNDCQLKQVSDTKYLSMIIDQCLSFKPHIQYMQSEIIPRLNMLHKVR